MLKIDKALILRGIVLALALCVTGLASAQERGSALVTAEEGQQARDEVFAAAKKFEVGVINGATRSDAAGTKMAPTSHMTWELDAPQLDPFGNEMVPVFNSAYSGR
jgi:hypothetical protein